MVLFSSSLVLASALLGIFSLGSTSSLPWDKSTPLSSKVEISDASNSTIVPLTYIVRLKSVQHGLQSPSKRALSPHEQFHENTKRAALIYSARQTYSNPELFVGLSLTLSSDDDLQALKDLDNVLGVWPVNKINRPSAAVQYGHSSSKSLKKRVAVPGTNITQPYIIGDIQPNNPHSMARVDDVHAIGVKGRGMKIAIIDTGVDFRHPSLGGCFGSGCKISFGYDFVGDDGQSPGPEPLATCLGGGHGTHVTGIIGMQDAPNTGFGLIGVAPEATLGMYRVFPCNGGGEDDIIISALIQAAEDGADVVTMSLGYKLHSETDDLYSTVTANLVAQGVAVFAANGNDGASSGAFAPSAPGSGSKVFAVGSIENTKFPTTYQLSDSNGRSLRYSAVLPIEGPVEGLAVQVMFYGDNSEALQGCYTSYYAQAAANLTIDPSKVILAVQNGGCGSFSKAQVAAEYGYKYLLSYETPDVDPFSQTYEDVDPEVDYGNPPITLNVEDSKTLLGSYGKHPLLYKIYLKSENYVAKSPNTLVGGFMSNFSSIGPLVDGTLKPQLSAPGGQILATWPLDLNGGYAVISGTSMSTPFMAASYALVKSQHPELSIEDTYALMMNSAGLQMAWYYDQSIISSAAQQGAGSLNVHNAITWESLVLPPQLKLKTSAKTVTANITIVNRSTRSKSYTFSHKAAGGVQLSLTSSDLGQQYPYYASASFSHDSILIPAGQSANVSVYITPPANQDPYLNPVYTGYVIVHNNYETYTVPYAGHGWDTGGPDGSLIATKMPIQIYPSLNTVNVDAPALHSYAKYGHNMFWTGKPDTTNRTFSMGSYGYPGILWGTTGVSDFIGFYLVPANTTFVPDIYGFDPTVISVPDNELVIPANMTLATIAGLDVAAVMVEYEGPIEPQDGETNNGFWWKQPDNLPPNGDYRVVMRALKEGGKFNVSADWDSWMSAILHIDIYAPFVPIGP